MFEFFYFHNCSDLNFGPTGPYYQEWNNLIARGMVAESKHRLTTNNNFINVVVSLLTAKYQFSRLRLHYFITSTKIHYWQISIFYGAPYLGIRFIGYKHCILSRE